MLINFSFLKSEKDFLSLIDYLFLLLYHSFMSQTKKRVIIVLSCVLFAFLYIILAFQFPGEELQFIPHWTVSVTKQSENLSVTKKQFPFKLGQNLGYFSEDGEILMAESFPYMATISNDAWSIFSSSAENTPFFDENKTKIGEIPLAGFPFFTEFEKFIFLPGGMSFCQLNEDGTPLWTYEDVTPITSFYPYDNGVIVGFAEGKIINFDSKGNILFSIAPGGSNYSVILGAAASSDGTISACVSGLNQQRFVLMKTAGGQTKTVFHEYLTGDLREQTYVKFAKDDTKVFYNEKNGLGVVDIIELKSFHLPLTGKILAIEEMEELNLFFVLTKTEGKDNASNVYRVYIVEDLCNLIGSFSFYANNAFILADGNNLYTGSNTTISKIEVTK